MARAAAILAAAALFCVPVLGCSGDVRSELPPHLIEQPEALPVRPIDGFEEARMSDVELPLSDAQYRERVEELYHVVVEAHKRPVFPDGDPVKEIYDAAIALLDRYILNSWQGNGDGAYNTVHALHDYLVCYVDYDFELYDRYKRGEAVEDAPSFDIDGVLLNKLAVCNGLSRAVAFLCAIEDIDCMQVTGTYQGVPHAWNRVKIGGEWYNLDVTADSANYQVTGESGYKKELSHGYFLLGDDTFGRFSPTPSAGDAHIFNVQPGISSGADCDYYAHGVIEVGGKSFPMTVTDIDTLKSLFAAIKSAKGEIGKVELKLAFPGKTNVNDGDVYESELRTAYGEVSNADFSFKENQKPYFRFPNGVYLCLIYK